MSGLLINQDNIYGIVNPPPDPSSDSPASHQTVASAAVRWDKYLELNNAAVKITGNQTIAGTKTFSGVIEGNLGAVTMKGNIIPDTDNAYDIGSAEYKIRDMYVSDNSLWVGDTHKIAISNGKIKFRKRKTNVVPASIATAGGNQAAALMYAGKSNVSDMKLKDWQAYMRTLPGKGSARIEDIFRDNSDDYEEDEDVTEKVSLTATETITGAKTFTQQVTIGTYKLPTTSGNAGQALKYPSSGNVLEWGDASAGDTAGDSSKVTTKEIDLSGQAIKVDTDNNVTVESIKVGTILPKISKNYQDAPDNTANGGTDIGTATKAFRNA